MAGWHRAKGRFDFLQRFEERCESTEKEFEALTEQPTAEQSWDRLVSDLSAAAAPSYALSSDGTKEEKKLRWTAKRLALLKVRAAMRERGEHSSRLEEELVRVTKEYKHLRKK
eukprot:5949918-Alexandrium_andersonii.AAC.1